MGSESTNPLIKHFRQPQLHIKLPSQGKWWAQGSLELPVTGELPVYAMTAKDEITAKTPDALLNGQATVDVIESCCPAVKNAWKLPVTDLDSILIAIRIATYGTRMEFTSVCPHCNTKNEHALDLNALVDKISCPDFDSTIKINGLEIYLRPVTFQDYNTNSMQSYEEQRLISVVADQNLPQEEKLVKFNELFKKLVSITVNQVVKSVGGIKTEDGILVEDPAQLTEFFENCERPVWDAVKARLQQLSDGSELRNIPVTCDSEECNKPYTAPLVFELSNFFG